MKKKGNPRQRKRKGEFCFFCFQISQEKRLRGDVNDHHHPPKCCVYPERRRIIINVHWRCHLKYNEIFKSILAKGYTPEEAVVMIEIPNFLEKDYKEKLLADLPEKETSPEQIGDKEIPPEYYKFVKKQIINYKLFMRTKKIFSLVCV